MSFSVSSVVETSNLDTVKVWAMGINHAEMWLWAALHQFMLDVGLWDVDFEAEASSLDEDDQAAKGSKKQKVIGDDYL